VLISDELAVVRISNPSNAATLRNAGTIVLLDDLSISGGDSNYAGVYIFSDQSTNSRPTLATLQPLYIEQLVATKGRLASIAVGTLATFNFPNASYLIDQDLEIVDGRINPSSTLWWENSSITVSRSSFTSLTGISRSNFTIISRPPFILIPTVKFTEGSRLIVVDCASLPLTEVDLDSSSFLESSSSTLSVPSRAFNLTFLNLDNGSTMTANNADIITDGDIDHHTLWHITGGSKMVLSKIPRSTLNLNVELFQSSNLTIDQSNVSFTSSSNMTTDESSIYIFTASNVTVCSGCGSPPLKSSFKSSSHVTASYFSGIIDWTFDDTSSITFEHSHFSWKTRTSTLPWASTTKVENLGNSSITWITPDNGTGVVSLSSPTIKTILPSGTTYASTGVVESPVELGGTLMLSSGSIQLTSSSITGTSGRIIVSSANSLVINSASLIEPCLTISAVPTQARGQIRELNISSSILTLQGSLSGTSLNLNNANLTNSTESASITFDSLTVQKRLWITTTPLAIVEANLQNAIVDAFVSNWFVLPHLTVTGTLNVNSGTLLRIVVSQLLPVLDQAHRAKIFKFPVRRRGLLDGVNIQLYAQTASNGLDLLGDCFSYDVDADDGSVYFNSQVPSTSGCNIYLQPPSSSPPVAQTPPTSAGTGPTPPTSSVEHNPEKKKSNTGLIVGIVIGILAGALVIIAAIFLVPILVRKYRYSKDSYQKTNSIEMGADIHAAAAAAPHTQPEKRWTKSAKPTSL
jgi:hypothetical protein